MDEVKFESRPGYLVATFPPYETADEARPFVDATLRECERTGTTRLMVDATANAIALSTLEYQRVAQYFGKQPGARTLRVALVRRPTLVEEAKRFEEMLVRRDLEYRVFPDVDQAERWLTGPTAPG